MHPVTRIFSFHHLASFSAGSAAVLAGLGLGQAAWADITLPDDIQAANARAAAKPIVSHELKKETPYLKPQPHSPDWGVFNVGKGIASGFGTIGAPGQPRWAEDWSDLAAMSPERRRSDWFNRLKYIPLTDKGDIWLSLSGEERLRYFFENQPMMGTAGKTNASRILLRNQYGADLHLGKHVRAYAEFLWGVAGGSNYYGYQTGVQRERLDLQQGILEVKGHLLGAKMGVIGGRQVFLGGPLLCSRHGIFPIPSRHGTGSGAMRSGNRSGWICLILCRPTSCPGRSLRMEQVIMPGCMAFIPLPLCQISVS